MRYFIHEDCIVTDEDAALGRDLPMFPVDLDLSGDDEDSSPFPEPKRAPQGTVPFRCIAGK